MVSETTLDLARNAPNPRPGKMYMLFPCPTTVRRIDGMITWFVLFPVVNDIWKRWSRGENTLSISVHIRFLCRTFRFRSLFALILLLLVNVTGLESANTIGLSECWARARRISAVNALPEPARPIKPVGLTKLIMSNRFVKCSLTSCLAYAILCCCSVSPRCTVTKPLVSTR